MAQPALRISARIEDAQIRRMLAAGDREVRQGVASALTKTARKLNTYTVRRLARQMALPQKVFRRRLRVRPARARGRGTLWSRVKAHTRDITPGGGNTGRAPRQNAAGVTWYGHRFGSQRPAPGYFVAPGGAPKGLIMRRRSGRRMDLAVERVPFAEEAEGIMERGLRLHGNRLLNRVLPHEVTWALERAARRR